MKQIRHVRSMKILIFTSFCAMALLATGCGKSSDSSTSGSVAIPSFNVSCSGSNPSCF